MDAAQLGRGRTHALRARLPAGLPPHRQPHDAEDLTQDVFVRVFRSLSTYTPGTFEGWLHRITTNLFLDQVRRKQRIRFDALADDAADRLPGREPTPAQAYDDHHFDGDVQQALDALAPDFRAAVVLCDIEGLSYEEIAATLGIKLGTVRSRIHRGRAQLRAALEHRAPRRLAEPGSDAGGDAVNHLGARVSALVDGQLGHSERDRALAHVAHCATCREAVDAERTVKALLASSAVPTPFRRTCWPACTASAEPGRPGQSPAPVDAPRTGRPDPPAARARPVRSPTATAGARPRAGAASGFATRRRAPSRWPGSCSARPSRQAAAPAPALHRRAAGGRALGRARGHDLGLPLGDPAFTAVTASFGGLTIAGTPPR